MGGGWTPCLVDFGASEVVSIDPGELLFSHPNVQHLQCMVQECDPETLGQFDVVECDMNYHRFEIVDFIVSCVSFLRSGGNFVLTLKGRKRGWERLGILTDREEKVLRPHFSEIRLTKLIANTKFETTLC